MVRRAVHRLAIPKTAKAPYFATPAADLATAHPIDESTPS